WRAMPDVDVGPKPKFSGTVLGRALMSAILLSALPKAGRHRQDAACFAAPGLDRSGRPSRWAGRITAPRDNLKRDRACGAAVFSARARTPRPGRRSCSHVREY